MNEIQKYIAAHEPKMMDDLFSLIRIPSISALPEHHDDMLACAERWAQLLLEAGVTLVPHRVEEKEPVESWLKQARLQQDVMRKQQLAVNDLTQRLVENKLIQQAKARLMKVQGLNEETAYQVMRSTAMKNSQSMAELARRILATLVD